MTCAEIAALVAARFPAVTVENASTPWLKVPAAELAAVAAFLRDEPELRFNSLMCLGGVDLLKFPGAASELAVAYQLHSLQHRHRLLMKVLLPRDAAEVPTISHLWPVALFFEREAFDLYGIRFTGHPDLRRLLMPDDWEGHPLRKDYAYPTAYRGVAHEREGQTFQKSPQSEVRGPKSEVPPAQAGVQPAAEPRSASAPIRSLEDKTADFGLRTSDNGAMVLSMGPQHPSTHGVLRLVVDSDGEIVRRVVPDIGFLHRSIEKIGEKVEWAQFVPYTDRVDYVCAMNANLAYCLAAERILALDPATAITVPRRAECIRVLVAELNRIASHLIAVGAMAMDLGAYTPFLHGIAQRETVNDIFERLCGQRLTYNYVTIGGVAFDLHATAIDEIRAFLGELEREMARFNKLITVNPIFRDRCAGVGTVSAADAVAWGLVGPNLRGSGVDWDLRRDEPYGLYGELGVKVPVGEAFAGARGAVGDSYDRYVVRLLEIVESIRLCRAALDLLPPAAEKPADPVGGFQADAAKALRKPPIGEVYCRSEAPRGEMGYHLVSDGTKVPYRVRIRTGSFTAVGAFEHLMRGIFLADIVTIIGSLDVVLPEVDR